MPQMRIFLITRDEDDVRVGRDETAGFVIAAPHPTMARKLAATQAGDEGAAVWMNRTTSTLGTLGTGEFQEPQIILRDFRAG